MDFERPVSSIIPGSTGLILESLVRASIELSLTSIAEISGVSAAQASRVLRRLVELGLVTRREVPPTSLFVLNRDHIAAKPIEDLFGAPRALANQLRFFGTRIKPKPANVTLFGSAARGEAGATSDIDVLVVRPDRVHESDENWVSTLERWSQDVRRLTGNPVNLIEVDNSEAVALLKSRKGFWSEILREGVTILGTDLRAVLAK